MTNFESKNILSGEGEDTADKENKKQEYKSNLTKWHEQEAERAKGEIERLNEESKKLNEKFKKLNEESKKLIESSEEKKKRSDGLSS